VVVGAKVGDVDGSDVERVGSNVGTPDGAIVGDVDGSATYSGSVGTGVSGAGIVGSGVGAVIVGAGVYFGGSVTSVGDGVGHNRAQSTFNAVGIHSQR